MYAVTLYPLSNIIRPAWLNRPFLLMMNIMEAIIKLWFKDGRIYILTDQNNTYSRPLEAFPFLLDATDEQRAKYGISLDGDDIHWDKIVKDRISQHILKLLFCLFSSAKKTI